MLSVPQSQNLTFSLGGPFFTEVLQNGDTGQTVRPGYNQKVLQKDLPLNRDWDALVALGGFFNSPTKECIDLYILRSPNQPQC